MSEEILQAASDIAYWQGRAGELSRQIGEQNTTIGYQEAMLRQAAVAAAALRDLLQVAIDTPWVGSDAHHKRHITAIKIRIRGHLIADYPGNALLAELEAARAVVEAVRSHDEVLAYHRLAAYDATREP